IPTTPTRRPTWAALWPKRASSPRPSCIFSVPCGSIPITSWRERISNKSTAIRRIFNSNGEFAYSGSYRSIAIEDRVRANCTRGFNVRKGRYLTANLAVGLVAVFLAVCGMLSAHTISHRVPAQSGEAAKQKPDGSQDPAFAEARRLAEQGKFDEAIGKLEALALKEPELKGLAHGLGVTYYKKSDYLKAVASFKKALEDDPADNEAVQLMGLSYYLAGRPAEAIGPLEKVQTWYPSANVDASYILGICYIQTKDYASARKAFAKMFDVAADSAASYLFTARMLLRQDYDP